MEKIPYKITKDLPADYIYVDAYSFGGFKELNPELNLSPYNYNMLVIQIPEYYPYINLPDEDDYSEQYLTFVAKADGTFTFTPQNSNVISYKKNDGDWTEGNTVEVLTGDEVLWKGEMNTQGESATTSGVGTFSATGNFDVQGNVMSLLYGDNFRGQTDLTEKTYAFYRLFRNNTKVINANNLSLPSTTLAQACYNGMFWGCTSLVNAPELPATTLVSSCYQNMFRSCTSLTTAPELSVTTLAGHCYEYMFQDCTSLVAAPELPATTLISNCYQGMFFGCTSLVAAPELPATTLANNCYQSMFYNCASLTTAPVLPATTLTTSCYSSMFFGCTNLTTAPELPATTLISNCYQGMFHDCTNLKYVKAMFTTTPSASYTSNWVSGVSPTGTFVKNAAATWDVTGYNGIPDGWTVETSN